MAKPPTVLSLWEQRWRQPELPELLEPMKEQAANAIPAIKRHLDSLEGVESQFLWHGESWRWTYRWDVINPAEPDGEALAYLVPRPEQPLLAIPLLEQYIRSMPVRRLNRYVRDGIKAAKCSVQFHWAYFTPTAMTEVEALSDLLNRKLKFLNGQAELKPLPDEQIEYPVDRPA
jgi:hypothetical protein